METRRIGSNDPLGLHQDKKEPLRTPPGFSANIGIYHSVPITSQIGLVILTSIFGLSTLCSVVIGLISLASGDTLSFQVMVGCTILSGIGFGISIHATLQRRKCLRGRRNG